MYTDLKCPQYNHYQKQITTVCLDKNCNTQSRLCCLLCQFEYHNTHPTKLIEMSSLNEFIQKQCNNETLYQQSCTQGQKQQIQQLAELITIIDEFTKIINKRIENIKQRLEERIVKIQQSNLQYYYSQQCNNSQLGINYWNQFLQDILQFVEVDKCMVKLKVQQEGQVNDLDIRQIEMIKLCGENLLIMINQIAQQEINNDSQVQIQSIQPKQQKIIENLIQSEIEYPIQPITEIPIQINIENLIQPKNENPIQLKIENHLMENPIQIQPQKENPIIENPIQMNIEDHIQMNLELPIWINIGKLCFDKIRKHVDLVLIDQCTIKKTKLNSFAIAYAQEGFDPRKQSYAFGFKIMNLNYHGGVWVGVGNDEGGSVPSYKFDNYEKIGHSQYIITDYGYIYHHTDKQSNCQRVGISFKKGDKIQIKYDHNTKQLEFRKESSTEVIKMKITDMTQKLYPCAMLYWFSDQVQIIEY